MCCGEFLSVAYNERSGACYISRIACSGKTYAAVRYDHDHHQSVAGACAAWNTCAVSCFFDDNAAADDRYNYAEAASSGTIGRIKNCD